MKKAYNLAFKKAFIEFVTDYYLGSFYLGQQSDIDSLGLENAKLHGLSTFAGFKFENQFFPHSEVVKQVHKNHYTVKDTYSSGNYPELHRSLHSKAASLKTGIRNYQYECATLSSFFNFILAKADSYDLFIAYLLKLNFTDLISEFASRFSTSLEELLKLESLVVRSVDLNALKRRKELFDVKLNELIIRKQLFGW